jgi:hypothetical protein
MSASGWCAQCLPQPTEYNPFNGEPVCDLLIETRIPLTGKALFQKISRYLFL